jgi:prepilin-type N-terminal cleavage/methylation domain-containing protein
VDLERSQLLHFSGGADLRYPQSLGLLSALLPKAGVPRRGAFTLPEIMVAVFVSSILLTVLVKLFTVSVRTGTEELSRSSTEATALFILRAVEADLQNSSPGGISLTLDKHKLVVHPMDTALASRQITYRNELLFWNFDSVEKTLIRFEYENYFSSFDFRPTRLDETEISALLTNPNRKTARNFTNVSDFEVSNPAGIDPPFIGSPLTLSVTTEVVGATTRRDVTLTKAVQIRSSGN